MTSGGPASLKTTQHDEQAIRSLVDTWLRASERGDLQTVLTLMEEDVVFMTPGRAPFGKEAFAQGFEQMKDSKLVATAEIQEIWVLGDWAWLHNLLHITVTPADGAGTKSSGHVLSILHKGHDGQWRIARDANQVVQDED